MKLHGYCESCHKIKLIKVHNRAMVQLAMNKPVFGTCEDCLEQQARDRHPAFRNRRPI